jgi:carbon-monoxide dehydrogenase medium subunit
MVAVGAQGERVIRAADFFVDMLTTALTPGEILREIRINAQDVQGALGQSYMKVAQPASGFAVVGVAVNLVLDAGGVCQSSRIGMTGVAVKAYRASGVENALKGRALDAQIIAAAAEHAADAVDANEDLYASADYRRHLARVYTRRAIEAASSRAH